MPRLPLAAALFSAPLYTNAPGGANYLTLGTQAVLVSRAILLITLTPEHWVGPRARLLDTLSLPSPLPPRQSHPVPWLSVSLAWTPTLTSKSPWPTVYLTHPTGRIMSISNLTVLKILFDTCSSCSLLTLSTTKVVPVKHSAAPLLKTPSWPPALEHKPRPLPWLMRSRVRLHPPPVHRHCHHPSPPWLSPWSHCLPCSSRTLPSAFLFQAPASGSARRGLFLEAFPTPKLASSPSDCSAGVPWGAIRRNLSPRVSPP